METKSASRIFLEGFASVALLAVGAAAVVLALRVSRPLQRSAPLTERATPNTSHDFTLIQLGTVRRDQFLLDRRSGRIWQPVCDGAVSGMDCKGVMVFQEMYVPDLTPDSSDAAKLHRR